MFDFLLAGTIREKWISSDDTLCDIVPVSTPNDTLNLRLLEVLSVNLHVAAVSEFHKVDEADVCCELKATE